MEILNVSYDPTREFYKAYNPIFAEYWKKTTGENITLLQSHGGSGKQARSVIDGLEAHVVTLALAYDIDAIARNSGFISSQWQQRLPENSAPYTSTIVFLVRKGNPKHIFDWEDLTRPEVQVITPNPKTSGGARWNYLAAWGYAYLREINRASTESDSSPLPIEQAKAVANEFVRRLYKNVPVLDSGARAATTTFAQRGIGDVLITWENEAFLALERLSDFGIEMVAPSLSILTEPPVAWVDAVTKRRGTEQLAKEYLTYLYSPAGQRLAARHHFRPRYPEYADPKDRRQFCDITLFALKDLFGSWSIAQEEHFSDNGTFDRIFLDFSQKQE